MRIILDITRLLLRRGNATPTGIDRVELAYLARLLDHPCYSDVHFVVTTHVACGAVSKAGARRLLAELSQRWGSHVEDVPGPLFGHVAKALQAPIDRNRKNTTQIGTNEADSWSATQHAKLVSLALKGYGTLWKLLLDAKRISTCYVHVSHVCLEHPYIFRWLAGGHIKPIFFLHDIIPLDYPEYCGDSAYHKHLARVRMMATIGRAIIVNSHYTRQRLESFFAEDGYAALPTVVSSLGTELDATPQLGQLATRTPYFVHVGTIEARKNISLLFNVWREIIARVDPDKVPRLVLAGRRGWKSQSVFDALDRGWELAPYVVEVCGLNDTELAALIASATAVLAPSFVEGFGLAGAEALVRRVPVVASDIPAHREVLADAAILINPIDGLGWADAVQSLAWSEQIRQKRIDAASAYHSRTWSEHVDSALEQAFCTLRSDGK